jgi:hypothetical protein
MSRAVKVKLNTLYKVSMASEVTPAHYTPVTVEAVTASSSVTIRATTNPDFDGDYDDLPVQVDDMTAGSVYESKYTRSLQYVAFECSDSSAEIYVAGLNLKEVETEGE